MAALPALNPTNNLQALRTALPDCQEAFDRIDQAMKIYAKCSTIEEYTQCLKLDSTTDNNLLQQYRAITEYCRQKAVTVMDLNSPRPMGNA